MMGLPEPPDTFKMTCDPEGANFSAGGDAGLVPLSAMCIQVVTYILTILNRITHCQDIFGSVIRQELNNDTKVCTASTS